MNVHNILGNMCRNSLITIGLLISSLPTYANVTYKYTSDPIYVGEVQRVEGNEVQTTPGPLLNPQTSFPYSIQPPIDIGSRITASFTLASPLAPNSITPLHLESGGFNLHGATQGGLQSYSATGLNTTFTPITSDIQTYLTGPNVGTIFDYKRYSEMDGQVTTDASGHISAWQLNFILYDDGHGGGITLDQSTNPPKILNGFPFDQDALLSISSNTSDVSFSNVTFFNGVATSTDNSSFKLNLADKVFSDDGAIQFSYYTQHNGSITLVPEPETWAMMMMGLGLLGWQTRRLKY